MLEGHRMTAYTLLVVNRAKGKSLPPITKLFPVITDKPVEIKPPPSKEEFKAIAKRYLETWHQKKG